MITSSLELASNTDEVTDPKVLNETVQFVNETDDQNTTDIKDLVGNQEENILNTFFETNADTNNATYLKPEHKIIDVEHGDDTEIVVTTNDESNHLLQIQEKNNISEEKINDAVKFGLDAVAELVNVKEPKWFKMGMYYLKRYTRPSVYFQMRHHINLLFKRALTLRGL